MSEFLKFAFEVLSQVIYNLATWLGAFFAGLGKVLITGWGEYFLIFGTYFRNSGFVTKLLMILLMIILIAIPVAIIVLIVRAIVLRIKLKAQSDDNMTLYKEIGRLNKQVMDLMDEKNMILALKTGAQGKGLLSDAEPAGIPVGVGGVEGAAGVVGAIGGPADPLADPLEAPVGAVGVGGALGGDVSLTGDATIGDDAISNAAAAAAMAAAQAKSQAEEAEQSTANRFPKLHLVDLKYEDYEEPEFDLDITLQQFTENFRTFAASQMKLYYTPEIIRRFIAGMACSKILILEGISGTGKTSLPYAFGKYLDHPASLVSVQPSFRDRTELLGYFNEFSKRFNETEFLRALYEAGYRKEPTLIVLDEMNLARIEYYFAEMLSILEMPNESEWVIDLVPTAWPGDPVHLDSGKMLVSPSTWFVGTANNDDSTFTITDKVYDRAMPIELNERANPFECELQPRCITTYEHLKEMFLKAKEENPISDSTLAKMVKLDQYLQTRFRLSFGNRIRKQMYDFIPVYVACGGSEIDGLDYIVARKVFKKFESQNVAFARDEIKGLIAYVDKTFGENNMKDSRDYLLRIQNLY